MKYKDIILSDNPEQEMKNLVDEKVNKIVSIIIIVVYVIGVSIVLIQW